jgi:hypothetical protein
MSSEDKIKELRHSFTKSNREDLETPVKNQFGHTVLNPSNQTSDLSGLELSIGETGEPRADMKTSIFESEQFQEWLKTKEKQAQIETFEPEMIQEPIDPRKELISSLMSELDDLDIEIKPQSSTMRIVKKPEVDKQNWKSCSNPECLYDLPHDAKFCLKCGTAQLKKFCTECGFHFKIEEKFCPDCGTRR